MLRFENLDVRYGTTVHAVRGVTLHVPKGEFCVVLGSSGAGKSTLLRSVNGLAIPSGGSVWVGTTRVTARTLREVRACAGTIHQSFNLVPRLTVLANVLTGALQRVGLLPAMLSLFPASYRRKACALLAEVGLEEEYLYRRASQLSGGQQQRVAIARAFILDPRVVLADEPVASLDPCSSARVLELLKQASRRRGTAVLCSLHQVEFARQFADRIVGMRDGRIVFDGPPSRLDDAAYRAIYGEAEVKPDRDAAKTADRAGSPVEANVEWAQVGP